MTVATRSLRKKGVVNTTSHAVRAPNDTWKRAKARADQEGLAMNRVIVELLEGYGRNIYKLPQRREETVRVYGGEAPASAPAATPAA